MSDEATPQEDATMAAGLIIWHSLQQEDMVGKAWEVDIEAARDLKARCSEHGHEPSPLEVLHFIATMLKDEENIGSDDALEAATTFVALAAISKF
jgi:hypothetical protein